MSEGLRPLGKGEMEGRWERGRENGGEEKEKMGFTNAFFFVLSRFLAFNHTTYFITSLPSSPVSSTKGEGGGEGGAPSITLLSR